MLTDMPPKTGPNSKGSGSPRTRTRAPPPSHREFRPPQTRGRGVSFGEREEEGGGQGGRTGDEGSL